MTEDKQNSFMILFRLITPIMTTALTILVTIGLFLMTMLRDDICELKTHFTNHLSNHKTMELLIEQRLTRIETQVTRNGLHKR